MVAAYSLAQRELLAEWTVPGVEPAFGVAAGRLPDINGAGREDVAVPTGPPNPAVRAISSRSGETVRRIELTGAW